MYDIKIINGRYPDFATNSFIVGNIYILKGRIVEISNADKESKNVIDADGLIVSPGFIDIHSHEDELNKEGVLYTAMCALRMGVTTCLGGNCGFNYIDIPEFKVYIEKNGAPVNYSLFLGNNFLRQRVGFNTHDRYREATRYEIDRMKDIVSRYKEYGIVGLSYGIEYSPGISISEIIEIAKVLDGENHLLSAHYRTDCDGSVDAIKELISVSKFTGVPMQVSHIGSCSAMGFMKESLETIEKGINSGVDVMADCYPYDAFCTRIGSAVFDEGCFDRWNKTYSDILLTDAPYIGKRCDKDLFNRVRKDMPDMLVVAFVMNDDEVAMAYEKPFVMVGSDALYQKDKGHPRGAGSFPRVLSRYVKDRKCITLLEGIKKMTLLPAKRCGLDKKGVIKEGMDADICIFNPETIRDGATFENPTIKPEGIEYVILDGEIAVDRGTIINSNLGKYISKL